MRLPTLGIAAICALACAAAARAATLAPGDVLAVLAETTIARVGPGGVEPLFSAPASGLQTLYGIAAERGGGVLALAVVSGGGTQLVRVAPATGTHALVAPLPAFGLPFSLAIDRAGANAYLVDYSGDVLGVALASGAVTPIVSLPSDGSASFALALAPDGALYVSDDAQDTLLRIDVATGATETIAEGAELGGFYRAHGIDVDREGRIVGTRYDPPAIVRIDLASGAQETIAEGGLLDTPVDIEVDRDGTLLVGNLWNGDVVRVDPETGEQALLATPYLLTGLALVPWRECENGRDDDLDGHADFPADVGCGGASAANESPPCQDGRDNDGMPGIDFDGGAAANGGVALDAPDPQCATPFRGERASGCGVGGEIALLLAIARRRRSAAAR